ncbi:hypothetical protein HMP09_3065 [Sphingomonas sp. HMP9]|uniref:hypothetical protein n=1 Tax=Sphingomonas sp. HMP9 TaxID=1517554 RepID=UPI00159645EB|nr:hypothetical protein [Sphingomonas sp. HMP9]BCA63831.1 hypothetical protein HMP09_3065 [Sphingomonas sp. HMP9]
MKLKALTGGALAVAMMTTSVAASAAPASLSVANARTGSTTADKSKLAGGGGIFAILIAAGVAAIGIVAIVKDDNSDSN